MMIMHVIFLIFGWITYAREELDEEKISMTEILALPTGFHHHGLLLLHSTVKSKRTIATDGLSSLSTCDTCSDDEWILILSDWCCRGPLVVAAALLMAIAGKVHALFGQEPAEGPQQSTRNRL